MEALSSWHDGLLLRANDSDRMPKGPLRDHSEIATMWEVQTTMGDVDIYGDLDAFHVFPRGFT